MRPWLALVMFAGLILFAATLRQESLAAESYPPPTDCIIYENQVTINRYAKNDHTGSFAIRRDGIRYRLRGGRDLFDYIPLSKISYVDYWPWSGNSYSLIVGTQPGSALVWDHVSKNCYLAVKEILS